MGEMERRAGQDKGGEDGDDRKRQKVDEGRICLCEERKSSELSSRTGIPQGLCCC